MTEELKESISNRYLLLTEKVTNVIQVFEYQFGEELVDNSLIPLDVLLENIELVPSTELTSTSDIDIIITKEIADYSYDKWGSRGIDIMIKFPVTEVRNERDDHVTIYDLFVKIPVALDGTTPSRFTMNKATYTYGQFIAGYLHSHAPCRIFTVDDLHSNLDKFRYFSTPCTGQGPINNTINSLNRRYDLDIWGLYAFELSKYVTVESLAGGPYIRMSNIGIRGSEENINNMDVLGPEITQRSGVVPRSLALNWLNSETLGDENTDMTLFIRWFIKTEGLKIAYSEGFYRPGESLVDFWIRLSNSYLKWINSLVLEGTIKKVSLSTLEIAGLLVKKIIIGTKIYDEEAADNYELFEGISLFKFKNTEVTFHIQGVPETNKAKAWLLDPSILQFILGRILQIINSEYGKEANTSDVSGATYYI